MTGVYIWEVAQSALQDIRLLYSLAARVLSTCSRLFRSVFHLHSLETVNHCRASSTISLEGLTPNLERIHISDSPTLPSIAQLADIFLRLSTCLSLLSLLVTLSLRNFILYITAHDGVYASSQLNSTTPCFPESLQDNSYVCRTSIRFGVVLSVS